MGRRAARVVVALIAVAANLQAGDERVRHRGRFRDNDGARILGAEVLESLPGGACGNGSDSQRPKCKLTDLGSLGASRWLWFREDGVADAPQGSQGRLIEIGRDQRVEVVWGLAVEAASVWDAVVLRKPAGVFLHIPVRYSGTGALRDDFLFHWKDDHWQEVDTLSWIKEINLPACYGLWKGPFVDFESLSLDMPVWIDGDANCCPTGGTLRVQFAIQGDALKVVEWRHVRSEGDGSPWDQGRRIDTSKCGPRPE